MTSVIDILKNKPLPQKLNKVGITIDIPLTKKDVYVDVLIKDERSEFSESNADDIRKKLALLKKDKPIEKKMELLERVTQEPVQEIRKPSVSIVLKGKKNQKIIIRVEPEEAVSVTKTKRDDLYIKEKTRVTTKPKTIYEEPEEEIDSTMVVIDAVPLEERLPKKEANVVIKRPAYYQNNRQMFINFINNTFKNYSEEIKGDTKPITCDDASGDFKELLTHQKIVRDYINIYTPYRGLLLYHGLGSGKTCSSIAIAEGLKSHREIVVMTPASLRTNYREEIKNCGDPLYKKKQHWEFISVRDNPQYLDTLCKILGLTKTYVNANGGAWLVNVTKDANYERMPNADKISLNKQIDMMISKKYKFLNYNGLRNEHLRNLTNDYSINPFDNKVVIIDEAHNFVSRIVNKLGKPGSLSMRLYKYLMDAENCRVVMLSGTPIINYPNEVAVFFNILRGGIKTWNLPLDVKTTKKINKETLYDMIKTKPRLSGLVDYVEYSSSSKILTLTKNPFQFVNVNNRGVYDGVKHNEGGEVTDKDFQNMLINVLGENNIEVKMSHIKITVNTALPDNLDEFNNYFVNSQEGDIKNENLLKKRIIGLTSYFRDQEALMPKFDKDTDIKVIKIPMSSEQLSTYEVARFEERKLEKQRKKKRSNTDEDESSSTYKIFSRAFCNFVFPNKIGRPMPNDKKNIMSTDLSKMDEDFLDGNILENKQKNTDGLYELDDETDIKKQIKEVVGNSDGYDKRIQDALDKLKADGDLFLSKEGLSKYSPKLLNVLENLEDDAFDGLHLLYSQFRTIEGIGVFKLILEYHGFAEFKLKKDSVGEFSVDIKEEDIGKPTFVLYTGTETAEEKEIIRKVFNGMWDDIPSAVKKYVTETVKAENNNMGEVIKLIMITASGAEGISLRNVRYVHVLEPYWHPIRMQQVIGRARRICSHNELPDEKQNVQVFLYLMTFSKENLENISTELKIHDTSKLDKSTPFTSDETLHEISTIKENINSKILHAIKETSIDCSIHMKEDSKEQLVCYGFGDNKPENFSYVPAYENNSTDDVSEINKTKITWKARNIKLKGKDYALNEATGDIYDLSSFKLAQKNPKNNPILVAKLIKKGSKFSVNWLS